MSTSSVAATERFLDELLEPTREAIRRFIEPAISARRAVAPPGLEWTFGDRIRKARRVCDVPQAAFAKALGVSAQTVAAWELGTNEPRNAVAIAKRVELAYQIPASWLLGIEPPETTNAPTDGQGATLPRLDSNQEPADYRYESVVIQLRRAA